ncbi:zinc finger protein VAR3, chloroplastic [Apium graveolens]|uniref:zinc finger protein VAR3, chloroplastic n=1 Tax=Apium graveolens TaxID=4045 RepID=UPI003D7B7D49
MVGATRFLLILSTPLSLLLHRRSFSLYKRLPPTPFSPSTLSPLHIHPNLTLSLTHLPINTTCCSSSQPLHTQSNSINDYDHYNNNNYSINNQQHPWPEWSYFVNTLYSFVGNEPQGIVSDDLFVSNENLSQEFVHLAASCLAFARNRPQALGLLSRKDIEVVVQNGTPFLFQSAIDTSRRMRAFLSSSRTTVLETDKAQTVDLMKYILSYASNPSVSLEKTDYSVELVESSVRNLLSDLAKVIKMKTGDWICPRCSFMNFARNVKCLECEEVRPRRQLTGREWECPRCYFSNFGRNAMCLKCDCKRPGEASLPTVSSSSGLGYNDGDFANKRHIDSKLAANEEKAQRWFNKVSQSDNSSDLSSAAADEDFPEIMPIRKGENRFVVSTRKTPLERRLANSQNQRNVANEVPSEGIDLQNVGSKTNLDTSFSRRLDQIITRTPTISEAGNRTSGQNTETVRSNTPRSGSLQDGLSKGSNSGYVPFVPLPADMFAKKTESSSSENVGAESFKSVSSEAYNSEAGTVPIRDLSPKPAEPFQVSENPESTTENENKEKESADESNGWFKRVAELHKAPNSSSAISDDDFPDIMPMRKGENKFVVSKKKDRSLTSPVYKRQMAMEQANNNTFVPFVPFPPDYFAKKNKQQPDDMTVDSKEASGMNPVKSDDSRQGYVNINQESSKEDQQNSSAVVSGAQGSGYQSQSSPGSHALKNERWSTSTYSGKDETSNTGPLSTADTTRTMFGSQRSVAANASSRYAEKENVSRSEGPNTGSSSQYFSSTQSSRNVAGSTTPSAEAQKFNSGWSGKSLEGSAVKETDPLDMSEEAKAERWFRRVAQIKDSSELSQIPDEDFPSIMPMRKGVNRFVVSKRKTPLERRLTSPQYRRNLPVVSSDPVKKEDDSN